MPDVANATGETHPRQDKRRKFNARELLLKEKKRLPGNAIYLLSYDAQKVSWGGTLQILDQVFTSQKTSQLSLLIDLHKQMAAYLKARKEPGHV